MTHITHNLVSIKSRQFLLNPALVLALLQWQQITICRYISSASYQNKTFYIFSSVFSVELSIDWINKFFSVYLVVDFIV